MKTLGIDLAAQPKRTAACVIEDSRVTVLELGCDDARLLSLMAEADATGIDAPFGWPEPFTRRISEYGDHGVWPSGDPRELMYRRTDAFVKQQLGLTALSVSSDRIAVCAWRCASLLHRHGGLDRTGASNHVFEVYPAAALAAWGIPRKGYKRGDTTRAARAVIADALPFVDDELHAAFAESDDKLDAFIAALVARAAALGLTIRPTEEDRRLAELEGWIHVPEPRSLDLLRSLPRER